MKGSSRALLSKFFESCWVTRKGLAFHHIGKFCIQVQQCSFIIGNIRAELYISIHLQPPPVPASSSYITDYPNRLQYIKLQRGLRCDILRKSGYLEWRFFISYQQGFTHRFFCTK